MLGATEDEQVVCKHQVRDLRGSAGKRELASKERGGEKMGIQANSFSVIGHNPCMFYDLTLNIFIA